LEEKKSIYTPFNHASHLEYEQNDRNVF